MEDKVTKFTKYQPTAGWYLSFQEKKESLISEYFHLAKQVLVLGISVEKELLLWKFNCQNAFSYHDL